MEAQGWRRRGKSLAGNEGRENPGLMAAVLAYISAGLVGLWVEDVSLGEVTGAARGLRLRGQGAASAETETGTGTNVSA